MTDNKPDEGVDAAPEQNRTIVYLMGVVAVLLVAIIALLVFRSQSGTQTAQNNASQMPTGAAASGAMPGVAPSAQAQFDEKSATKVPDGTKPGDYVKAYYQAILDKKWDAAFKMQPAASQQGGSVDQFASTQEQYGMVSFKVTAATEKGDSAEVTVEQDLGANGKWGVVWTFAKSGKTWLVKQRQVSMNP